MIGTSLSGVTFISVPGAVGSTAFGYLQIKGNDAEEHLGQDPARLAEEHGGAGSTTPA